MRTVLLIAHGTRDPRGNDEARAAGAALERSCGRPVRVCFLEHAEPGIPEAIAGLHADGVRAVTALPMILTAAGHVKNDIPAAIRHARDRFPDLQIESAGHLGAHAALLAVLAARFDGTRDQESGRHGSLARTGIVVIGRGAADPDANAEVFRIARLLWESRPAATLTVGFMGVTRPTAAEAIADAARTLAESSAPARLIVIPYFLFEGLLLERLRGEAAALAARGPIDHIRVAPPIGPDPGLVATLAFRLEELVDGTGHLNCGTCLYRVPMGGRDPAREDERARALVSGKLHLGAPHGAQQ